MVVVWVAVWVAVGIAAIGAAVFTAARAGSALGVVWGCLCFGVTVACAAVTFALTGEDQ